jgi:hypothetical protein
MLASISFASFGRIDSLYVLFCHVALYVHIGPAVRAVQSEQAWCSGAFLTELSEISHTRE